MKKQLSSKTNPIPGPGIIFSSLTKKLTQIIFILFLSVSVIAQHKHTDEKPVKIGSLNEFTSNLKGAAGARTTKERRVQTSEGDITAIINVTKTENGEEVFIGEIKGKKSSNISFNIGNGKLEGVAVMPEEKTAFKYSSDAQGNVYVTEVDIHDVMCIEFQQGQTSQVQGDVQYAIPPSSSAVYKLQSLPGATAVAYLDFDGELVVGSRWAGGATIDAQPMDLTEAQIQAIFNLISEDLRPFNINVTTDRAVFNASPLNRRQMCIFTITKTAAPSAGGVAYLNSFSRNSDDSPCWVYNQGIKGAGETGSHELGHTFGLSHDGNASTTYYGGHGNWAPIMGNSMGSTRTVTHWSRGEYQGANMTQDDIAIIANTTNGFGFRTDDAGNTPATAKALVVASNGSVAAAQNGGLISTRTDIDVFSFTCGAGTVNLTANSSAAYANLDILAWITNASGATVATANPTNSLSATISVNVPAGTYYLHIDGTGNGDPLTTGYSDYSSLGLYTISGTIPTATVVNQPPVVNISSPANNASFTAPANISFTSTASDPDGTVTRVEYFNGSSKIGEATGSPYTFTWSNVAAGTYSITARATDNSNATTTSSAITINVVQPTCDVPTGLGANNITSTSANLTWAAQGGAVSYLVFVRPVGGSWLPSVTATTNNVNFTGLQASTQYEFTVRSNCSSTNSAYSSPYFRFTTAAVVATCNVPGSLGANNITTTSANLTWSAQTGAVSYLVFVRPVGGSWLPSVTASTNSVNFTGLQASTQYEFTVRTNCSSNSSAYASPYFRFTTTAVVATCNVPASLGANNLTTSSANLTWAAQSGAASYLVFVRPVGGSWLSSVTTTTNSVNFTGLQAGTQYEFTVRSNCSSTNSAYASPYFRFTTSTAISCSAPAWNRASIYVGEDRVSHNGSIWRAKWWTQGEEPGTTGQWGVWEQIAACSGIAAADEETDVVLSVDVIAAPHPFTNQTAVSLSNGEKIVAVNIYDVQGKLVSTVNGNNTDNLTVGNDLGAGLFIMHIITNNGSYKRNIIKTY
ncbi:MAG: fibronectin type III domain-containing protein [Cytophagaceae bacterium]